MAYKDCERAWELSAGQVVELDDAHGTQLRITRGSLWVTMERDVRDVVLGPGETFVIDRNGVTLAEAQGRTTLCVQGPHAGARRTRQGTSRRPSIAFAWLRRWYGAISDPRRFVPYV